METNRCQYLLEYEPRPLFVYILNPVSLPKSILRAGFHLEGGWGRGGGGGGELPLKKRRRKEERRERERERVGNGREAGEHIFGHYDNIVRNISLELSN